MVTLLPIRIPHASPTYPYCRWDSSYLAWLSFLTLGFLLSRWLAPPSLVPYLSTLVCLSSRCRPCTWSCGCRGGCTRGCRRTPPPRCPRPPHPAPTRSPPGEGSTAPPPPAHLTARKTGVMHCPQVYLMTLLNFRQFPSISLNFTLHTKSFAIATSVTYSEIRQKFSNSVDTKYKGQIPLEILAAAWRQ